MCVTNVKNEEIVEEFIRESSTYVFGRSQARFVKDYPTYLIWDTGSDILNTIEVYSSALTFALEQYRTSGINRYMSI